MDPLLFVIYMLSELLTVAIVRQAPPTKHSWGCLLNKMSNLWNMFSLYVTILQIRSFVPGSHVNGQSL